MELIENLFNTTLPITDPVLIFAIVMLIILIAPMVFDKLKLPGIVGLILSGTIVGPSVLGLLERDDTIILLGTVGLLYLMFMAGLSIDLTQFNKLRNKSLSFGLLSFFIPQLLAIWVGVSILEYSLSTALLLGSIVGSHTLLAYPIANRLGITKNIGVTMTMGGTIVTDTLSLVILALVVASMDGELNTVFWIEFLGYVGLYTAAMLIGLPRLGRLFFRNVRNQTNTEYVFLIAVLFTTAWLAEVAGLAAIVGAFLAGLTMNRLVPENSTLMSRVQFVGNALFIPFFLLSVGMLVDVSILLSAEVWIVATLFTGLVMVGKLLAAKGSQFIFRLSSSEGWTIFGLSIPQAAATLAVTLIGYDLGFFDDNAVNAVVIMILITCLVGPSLVENFGRKVAILEDDKPYDPGAAPQRLLIPLANPSTSQSLMDLAMMIRNKNSQEPLYPLTVARDDEKVEAQVAESEKMLSHAVVHAAAADIPVVPITRVDMNIASGIVRAIKELRITNVVIGWNGDAAPRRKVFGSVLDQLLEQTDEMVMVCKFDQPLNTTKRIVLAVPPLAEREPGFNITMSTVKTMVQQLGSDLKIIATRSNIDILEEFFLKKDPEIEADFKPLSNWHDLFRSDFVSLKSSEMMILNSARTGSISWQPSLEKLPGQISRSNPDNNFLIIYPTEQIADQIPVLQIDFQKSYRLPGIYAQNITIQLDDVSFEEAITSIMKSQFKDNERGLEAAVNTLLRVNPDNTPGELPGILLTHGTSAHVKEPILFLGLSSSGIHHDKIDEPIHVIFILLVPINYGMQRTLNILGKITRLIRSPKMVEKLSNATTIQEIRDVLSAKLVFKENKENSNRKNDTSK